MTIAIPRGIRPALERLEDRRVPSTFRSYDGSGNNLAHPDWGTAGSQLVRISPAAYGDGISTPAGAARPGAREISNAIIAETEEVLNDRSMSDFIYVFGQMVDHDLDLTVTAPGQPFGVPVPAGDPFFDPAGTGTQVIFTNRSKSDPTTGTGAGNPRQQVNEVTAWLDGSVIYGSSEARALALRTLQGGRLRTSFGNRLPFNTTGLDNQNQSPLPADQLFVAGDRRVNENIELTALQTVWLREHNRLADLIQGADLSLTDEEVYQQARRLVVAQLQHITYSEYLPALLGQGALHPYTGYKPGVNPGIANEFAHAAFRVGHTLLGDDVEFLDDDGEEVAEELPLSEAFFNPAIVQQVGIEPILKYLATDKAREVDMAIVNGVRNFLFGPPGAGGFDLAALDIQRGRDHGLADYNTMRAAYGLPRVTNFAQITSDRALQRSLRDLYGSVNNIDAFVGGMAENHVRGASVGPLFRRIIISQFERVRDGDRFWYERDLSARELAMVRGTTLSALLRRNTTLSNLQDNAFFFDVSVRGRVFFDANRDGRPERPTVPLPRFLVQLRDDQGQLIATTRIGLDGTYKFAGVIDAPGEYSVRLVPPARWRLSTANPASIHVTRGEAFRGVNFGVFTTLPTPAATGRRTPAPANQAAPGGEAGLAFANDFFARLAQILSQLERRSNGPRL